MSERLDSALAAAAARFAGLSESPRLDAELLLAHALGKPRSYLYAHADEILAAAAGRRFARLVEARLRPTPVAWLLGRREFFSLEFVSRPGTLVPRPETEELVELALAAVPRGRRWRICDLGTGSGIIAVTLKKHRPLAEVTATDVDPACLALAYRNALLHAVDIHLQRADWYRGLSAGNRFDLLVSNPPYIAAAHPFLATGDLPAEPRRALAPGESGLEALDILIGGAPDWLAAGGRLIVEHGYDQQRAVESRLHASGFVDIHCVTDINGLPRVSSGHLH